MSIQLDESLFEDDFSVDMNEFYISDYTDNFYNFVTINTDDYDDSKELIEKIEENIVEMEISLENIKVEYASISEFIKSNMVNYIVSNPFYMDGVSDSYWESLYSELEDLLDKDDVQSVFGEINDYTGIFSIVEFDDVSPITQKMIKKLEIENDVRWDKELLSYSQFYVDMTSDSFEYIHQKVVDELKKRINDSKESLKNIDDIFVF